MRKRELCLWASLIFFCLPLLFASPSSAAERYTVKPGDSLHKIAKKYHVSVDTLKEANRLEGDTLRPNQVLVIPGGKSAKKIAEKSAAKKKSGTDATVYVVKTGRYPRRGVGKNGCARIGDQEDKRASVIEVESGTAACPGETSRKSGRGRG